MPVDRITFPACLAALAASFFLAQPAVPGPQRQNSHRSGPSAQEAAQGKKVFDENCEVCHFDRSTKKKIGPGLAGLSKRARFADGKRVDDASVRTWIEKGGKSMPGFKNTLSEEQMRELIAYLKTL